MNSLLAFFFSSRCLLCGDVCDAQSDILLCATCSGDLQQNINACDLCATPLPMSARGPLLEYAQQQEPEVCAQCLKKMPVYDLCWSPFLYVQPLVWMIQQLKFSAKLNCATLLSNLMMQQLPTDFYKNSSPDAIIPMPLHPRRLKQRGFNQSLLLVKPMAKLLGLPIDMDSCRRVRDTEHQTGKNAHQRRLSIKGAFTFENKHYYRHVVIFDDVVTTGSSVSELSKVIKQAGVSRVDVWCLAMVPGHNAL